MRVIAGLARGRKLRAAPHNGTRPTPARVREALFSRLAPHLDGARVLDLFAGSGALGIEAISRGARSAVFVEHDKVALTCLRQNLAVLPALAQRQCTVRGQDALKAVAALQALGCAFELILVDAPFASGLGAQALDALAGAKLLAPAGCIVLEHAKAQPAPKAPATFTCADTRTYGEVALATYVSYSEAGESLC